MRKFELLHSTVVSPHALRHSPVYRLCISHSFFCRGTTENGDQHPIHLTHLNGEKFNHPIASPSILFFSRILQGSCPHLFNLSRSFNLTNTDRFNFCDCSSGHVLAEVLLLQENSTFAPNPHSGVNSRKSYDLAVYPSRQPCEPSQRRGLNCFLRRTHKFLK